MISYKDKRYICALDLGFEQIRGKWKAVILCHLDEGPKRFLALQHMRQNEDGKTVAAMVKVIHTAGGFSALGNRVVRGVRTARGTQLAAGLLGVLVFFDDYASALITGPVMWRRW